MLQNQPENRLAAMVDFTFNLGAGRLLTSTLRRRINQMDWAGAALALRKLVHGGGRGVAGLGGAAAGRNCADESVDLILRIHTMR